MLITIVWQPPGWLYKKIIDGSSWGWGRYRCRKGADLKFTLNAPKCYQCIDIALK